MSDMKTQLCFPRLVTALSALLLFTGCQSGSATWEALTPKKAVPPYEEVTQDDISEEKIVSSEPLPYPASTQHETVQEEGMQPPVVKEVASSVMVKCLLDSQYVASRLDLYTKKQLHWRNVTETFRELDMAMGHPVKWSECVQRIDDIVTGYATLGDIGQVMSSSTSTLFNVFQLDILYLESECRPLFTEAVAAIPDGLNTYRDVISGQAKAVLFFYAGQQEYDKVVAAYHDLLVTVPRGKVSPELLGIYAHALQATGDLEQAALVFLEVADVKGDGQGWPQRLQAAQLLFAQGEFVRAREEYQRIASFFSNWRRKENEVQGQVDLLADLENHPKEIRLYGQALHGWLLFDGSELPRQLTENVASLERGFPGSDYARMARQLLDKASGSTGEYVELQLQVVQDLVTEKEFGQALELLELLAKSSLPPEKTGLIQDTLAEVRRLNVLDVEEKKLLKEQELATKWQESLDLFDQQKYDSAIAAFEGFLNTDYHEQAKGKIIAAANLAAADLRKQAAGLFVKSRKVVHTEQKLALLMESRHLLLTVREKYSQADVISKVIQNQQAIEEQIRGIDPDLLEEKLLAE